MNFWRQGRFSLLKEATLTINDSERAMLVIDFNDGDESIACYASNLNQHMRDGSRDLLRELCGPYPLSVCEFKLRLERERKKKKMRKRKEEEEELR